MTSFILGFFVIWIILVICDEIYDRRKKKRLEKILEEHDLEQYDLEQKTHENNS